MKPYRSVMLISVILTFALFGHCSAADSGPVVIKTFPLNSLEGLLATEGVYLDKGQSKDGGGSIRIEANKPMVVRLFEVEDPDVEDATLMYSAHVRTGNVVGFAYLEMWCRFPDKGEYFSRGLDQKLTGTNDWIRIHTPFFLKKGQNPDLVRLNLVINGTGIVWVDGLRLEAWPNPK